jgi:hypothetical protein
VFLSGGVGVGFLQQWEEGTFEQLLHSCAGGPGEFLFDNIERNFDCLDLLLDLGADGSEVEFVVAPVVVCEEVGREVLPTH